MEHEITDKKHTVISISVENKKKLKLLKIIPRESYNDLITRLLNDLTSTKEQTNSAVEKTAPVNQIVRYN